MKDQFTNSQVDRLGNRLRSDLYDESDLIFLDEYRKSFHKIYKKTVKIIRNRTNLEPTGRPAKSTKAIIEKLKRETIRLSQVQDIAGCRIVVGTIIDQNQIVSSLLKLFPKCDIVDRRLLPSHGYRGVHIIVNMGGKLIEIQVRSKLQHLWAEFSEKLSDVMDPSIKYGGGNTDIQVLLQESTNMNHKMEYIELKIDELKRNKSDNINAMELSELQDNVVQLKREIFEKLNMFIQEY